MDILKPQLFWIGDECYRVDDSAYWKNQGKGISTYEEQFSEQHYYEMDDDNGTAEGANIEIEQMSNGTYKHTFPVHRVFYCFIIGAKGMMKRNLELETSTSIKVPQQGSNGDIVITGKTKRGIVSARHRIDLLIESSRNKLRPTHFISIPIRGKSIIDSYEKFKNEVPSKYQTIKEEYMQKLEKMHLTVAVMVLLEDSQKEQAISLLNECNSEIIKPMIEKHGPIEIKFQGVDTMTDDLSRTRILYAKVFEGSVLQELVDQISQKFFQAGLSKSERSKDTVKLHMTLINTKYAMDKKKRFVRVDPFDATGVMEDYKSYDFGSVTMGPIHLSEIDSKGEDGYYLPVTIIETN